jgi:hypothetical protein
VALHVALALAHPGRRAEAAELAEAELRCAERFSAPRPIAAALHARALAGHVTAALDEKDQPAGATEGSLI